MKILLFCLASTLQTFFLVYHEPAAGGVSTPRTIPNTARESIKGKGNIQKKDTEEPWKHPARWLVLAVRAHGKISPHRAAHQQMEEWGPLSVLASTRQCVRVRSGGVSGRGGGGTVETAEDSVDTGLHRATPGPLAQGGFPGAAPCWS